MWSFFSKDSATLSNFEVQEQITLDSVLQQRTIWFLNNVKKKGNANNPQTQSNDLNFSAFTFSLRTGNESWLLPAKNCFKRMKMLRHPNLLMFQDGVESEKLVQIVTERVTPLSSYLNESKDNESQKENEISWGLHQIATGLTFLSKDCKLVHNNVCSCAVVVNRAGDWKLTGFEFSHPIDDQNVGYKVLTSLDCYEAPEKLPANNINTNRNSLQANQSAVDSYGFGCLIWEIFNGLLPNSDALKRPGQIPKRLVSAYKELINPNPSKRLSLLKFIDVCRQTGGFMDNHFVETLLFLEQIKDQAEKNKFFSEITPKLDDFPRNLCLFKILPELMNAHEFGNAGASIMPPLFKLSKLLDEAEYQKCIIPVVVKLFGSTDRATRMKLLQQLNTFVEHLSAAIINDQIFGNICQGFSDTNPTIRENTIRAIVLLAPKLNYNNLNVELMKHFARLQGQDEQGMIRTNTTVCIGKIAIYINPQLRQRILLSAFPKAMRDPYPLARLSGIVALANTDRFYTLRDIASKIMPSLYMLTIDPEKDVRDEAFKTIKLFTQKLEKVSEKPELALEMEKEVTSCTLDLKNETSWTSWAMGSLSAKVTGYKTKAQQPSVALNTQPLAPPPSMSKEGKQKTPEKLSETPINIIGSPKDTSVPKNEVTVESDNFNSGWGDVDDENWKDIDDDNDMMEPLEPTNDTQDLFSSQKTKFESVNPNNDWTEDWAESFETTTKNKPISKINAKKSNNMDRNSASPSMKPASSYNWSNSNTNTSNSAQAEEDLFASLVKDVKLNNDKTPSTQLKTNSSSSGWTDDWSNVLEAADKKSDSNIVKGGMARKSKPLKLGQKKNMLD